jgi:hypothetical protein
VIAQNCRCVAVTSHQRHRDKQVQLIGRPSIQRLIMRVWIGAKSLVPGVEVDLCCVFRPHGVTSYGQSRLQRAKASPLLP